MEPTIRDIVVWVDDVALSSAQIQKVYDWRITLWGALSNAILTAVFFIIATALVETYKETLKLAHFWSGFDAPGADCAAFAARGGQGRSPRP